MCRRYGPIIHPRMLPINYSLSTQDKLSLLNCRRLPARLNSSETAVLLGLNDHDVTTLIAAKLLLPLGKPAQNAPKYFAAVDVLMRAEDREWLPDVTNALARHWQAKNRRNAAARLHVRTSHNGSC